MKATKKIFALLATVGLMASCSQDDLVNRTQNQQPAQNGITSLKADIEGASRSAVTDGGVFSWTEGDVIGVYDGQKFEPFTYNGSSKEFEGYAETPSDYAIYPYNEEHKYEDETITVKMPAKYEHGSTNAIMLAEVSESNPANLTFKHLGGVMRFIVRDVPAGATEFVFTAEGKGITGDFTVNGSDGEKVIEAGENPNSNNSVTIKFTELATPQDMVFYVPVPVGEYSGYSVAINGENGLSLSDGSSSQSASNTVNRRSLLLMPEFSCISENGSYKLEKSTSNTVTLEAQEQTLSICGDNEEVLIDVPTNTGDTKAVLNVNFTPTESSGSDNPSLTISDGNEGPSTTSEAEVVVNIPSGSSNTVVPDLTIEAPTLTVTLASGTYGTVTAKTATETLIVKSGVTIETLTVTGGNYIIEEGAQITTTTVSGNTVQVIETLEGLKNAFQNGGSYKLVAPLTIDEKLTVSNDLALDFNGNTLTMGAYTMEVSAEKTLTLSNGSATGSGDIITARKNSKIYIGQNVNLTSSDNCCIFIPNGANDVTVETAGNLISTSASYAALYVNGSVTSGDIHVKGGEITSSQNTAVYVAGQVNLTIEGTTISGITGVEIRAGRLDMYGGTITAIGDPFNSNSNDNGSTSVGAAVAVCQHTTDHPLYANIYDGTFSGARALYEEDLQNEIVDDIGLNVKGGTFVGEILSTNCIGFIHGGTFNHASAFSYLAEKASIVLESEIKTEDPIVIGSGQTVTLDLNGYTIEGQSIESQGVIYVDGGSLTINDNAVQGTGAVKTVSAYPVEVRNGGSVVINGGNFTATNSTQAVYVHQGKAVINGGYFGVDSQYGGKSYVDSNNHHMYTLNCLDANYQSGAAAIIVKGGEFFMFNPGNNVAEGQSTNFLEEGYNSTAKTVEGGTCYVVSAATN